MSAIIISNLNLDTNLDQAALAAILGGTGTAVVGSGNTVAIGGCKPIYQDCYQPCYQPCYPNYGPRAFQLSYNTSFEQSYYQKAQTSFDLSYFQA